MTATGEWEEEKNIQTQSFRACHFGIRFTERQALRKTQSLFQKRLS